jgi:3-hydroxyisobutyrate dehydrogenase
MAHIGFLGTGNMGIGMAARLLEAGHNVRVFNRTKIKAVPLIEKGAVFADTPRQAAEGADAIIAMVGDDAASRAVWLGDEGA